MSRNIKQVLSEFSDFKKEEHPALNSLFQKVEKIGANFSSLKSSRLTPKQVNYLNLKWLDGLYQAYYETTLNEYSGDEIPKIRTIEDPYLTEIASQVILLEKEYVETFEYLLKQGLPLEKIEVYGDDYESFRSPSTILEKAFESEKFETAALLLESGVEICIEFFIEYVQNWTYHLGKHEIPPVFEKVILSFVENSKNRNMGYDLFGKLRRLGIESPYLADFVEAAISGSK